MIELLAALQDPPAAVTWAQIPQVDFPADAMGRANAGSVTLSCAVTAEGRAETCAVVREEPSGFGFAREALAAAPTFRFNPSSATPPVDQGATTFTIRFRLEQEVASDAVQRAVFLLSDLSFTSGRCHLWIETASRKAFERAVEQSVSDADSGASTMTLGDVVRSSGYRRGQDSARTRPPTEAVCRQILKDAAERYEAAAPDIEAAQTALNSVTRTREGHPSPD
ncbi:MAG: TonB family protein [Brevundimonas sp.]|nr:MAG: TonB family protein [Brevundimonas sp.]